MCTQSFVLGQYKSLRKEKINKAFDNNTFLSSSCSRFKPEDENLSAARGTLLDERDV